MKINTRYKAVVKETGEIILPEDIDAISIDECLQLKSGRYYLNTEVVLLKSIGKNNIHEEIFETDIIKSERFKSEAKIVWDGSRFRYCAQLLTDDDKDVDEDDMSVWNKKGTFVALYEYEPFALVKQN